MQRRGLATLAVIGWLASSSLATGEELEQLAPLHVIPTGNQSAQPVAADGPVRVRLTATTSAQALAGVLGIDLPANQTSFDYVIDRYPQLRNAGARTWLEPTFVIDFNEPEFEPLQRELDARGPTLTRPQLVEYVAGLVEKSDQRSWDLASVVARHRRGDCSEYAVLTTALARMRGIPARVVVGAALVSQEANFGAFGHAWTEMLEDGEWKVADAALFDLQASVRYLPIGLMEEEGMGYAMGLAVLTQNWIDRVVVLGPR